MRFRAKLFWRPENSGFVLLPAFGFASGPLLVGALCLAANGVAAAMLLRSPADAAGWIAAAVALGFAGLFAAAMYRRGQWRVDIEGDRLTVATPAFSLFGYGGPVRRLSVPLAGVERVARRTETSRLLFAPNPGHEAYALRLADGGWFVVGREVEASGLFVRDACEAIAAAAGVDLVRHPEARHPSLLYPWRDNWPAWREDEI